METETQIPTHIMMTTTTSKSSSSTVEISSSPSSSSKAATSYSNVNSKQIDADVENKLALLHDDAYKFEFFDKDHNEIEKFGSLRSEVKKEEFTNSDINKNDTNLKIIIHNKTDSPKNLAERMTAKLEQGTSTQSIIADNNLNIPKKPKKSVKICLNPSPKESHQIKISTNGKLPKSGKPMMSDMNKKLKPRGRPKRKALVAMYQSEISANKMGIKLCIKKSDTQPKTKVAAKTNRKRSRKPKQKREHDSEDSDIQKRRKKESAVSKKNSSALAEKVVEEQTCWGDKIPENVLYKVRIFLILNIVVINYILLFFQIFQNVVNDHGCLPSLIRLGKTCSLWHRISLSPSLWHTLDFSQWTKERFKTELKLKWLIENRMAGCTDVNMSK